MKNKKLEFDEETMTAENQQSNVDEWIPKMEVDPGSENALREEEFTPIFDQIKGMNPEGAINILIQASQMAQSAGALTIRDSVMVAAAVNVFRPGSI